MKKHIPIISVIVFAFIFNLYKLSIGFNFDYDQQVPAIAAYDFFINHKISLIGQELSFQGFFLGPLHNIIQFIPYGICNLKPDCVPYFFAFTGLITIAALYYVINKIFDRKTAVIASSIYAFSFQTVSYEMGVNSNYFLFLSSLGLLFCLYKYLKNNDKYSIIGAFITGLATVNFNPLFLFSGIAYALALITRKNRKLLVFALAAFAFLINYLPLAIFNFRHQNLLIQGLESFSKQNSGSMNYLHRLFFAVAYVQIPFLTNYLFQHTNIIYLLLTVALIASSVLFSFRHKDKSISNKLTHFLFIWIAVVPLGLAFYKGHIPDYYYEQSILPFIIIISLALRKSPILFLFFIPIFLTVNIISASNFNTSYNYKLKKDVVNFIIGDAGDKPFNVYYDMPPGLNSGYGYLFKVSGKEPQEGAPRLYLLEFQNPWKFHSGKYYSSFPKKMVNINVIGFVHIISVK